MLESRPSITSKPSTVKTTASADTLAAQRHANHPLQSLLLLRQACPDHCWGALGGDLVRLGTGRVLFDNAEIGFTLKSDGQEARWRFAYDRRRCPQLSAGYEGSESIYKSNLFSAFTILRRSGSDRAHLSIWLTLSCVHKQSERPIYCPPPVPQQERTIQTTSHTTPSQVIAWMRYQSRSHSSRKPATWNAFGLRFRAFRHSGRCPLLSLHQRRFWLDLTSWWRCSPVRPVRWYSWRTPGICIPAVNPVGELMPPAPAFRSSLKRTAPGTASRNHVMHFFQRPADDSEFSGIEVVSQIDRDTAGLMAGKLL